MIRPMEARDRDAYLGMAREFYAGDAVSHHVPPDAPERTFCQVLAGGPYLDGYLLEHDSQPAGYGLVALTYSPEAGGLVAWLDELYIRPNFRGRGLGRAYFEYMRAAYRGRVARFRLEVSPGNGRAAQLYARLGYRPLDYSQMVLETPKNDGRVDP